MKTLRRLVSVSFVAFTALAASTVGSLGADPTTSSSPGKVKWISGPATADIGNYGQIQIPDGFMFADKDDAAVQLKLMNNPVPSALAGILAPISRKYMVVLEYDRVGYVQDSREALNPKTILKSIRAKVDRQNAAAAKKGNQKITSVTWEMEPEYDRVDHMMEWAIRAKTEAGEAVNHIVRIFGREGMLDGIAVQSANSNQKVPLKELISGISFKPGHTYADYQDGDRVATQSLVQLITSDDPADNLTDWTVAYVIGGILIVVLGGGGFMAYKRMPRQPTQPDYHTAPKAVKFLNGSPTQVLATNGNGNGHANGELNGHDDSQKKGQRKIFDYHRYYTDLLSQVSDRSYEPEVTIRERQPVKAPAPQPATATASDSSQLIHSAHLGLIESQKRLIEEQQRLIREQSKLIEEKTRLIQEKNYVLEKQEELFGNNSY